MPRTRLPFNRRASITAFYGFKDAPLGDDNGCCGWRYGVRSLFDYLRTLPWYHIQNAYYAVCRVPYRFWEFINNLSWSKICGGVVQWFRDVLGFLLCIPQSVYGMLSSLSWVQFRETISQWFYNTCEFLRHTPQHVKSLLRSLSWRCIRGNLIDWWWRRSGAEQY